MVDIPQNNCRDMNPVSQHQNAFISFVESANRVKNFEKCRPLQKKVKVLDKFCCDKCRFSSRDIVQFHKHTVQHEEMTFSCSYCNHVSYTRGESQRHLVKHTGTFPFRCQFCPYGAVRNDYIVKHTQRVHQVFGDKVSYRVLKKRFHLETLPPSDRSVSPAAEKNTHKPPSNINAGVQSVRADSGTAVSYGAVKKTGNTNGLSKVQVELLSPLNEPIQHDKPLTIAYPPEMTIPPGCLVELVEVKTVNGTRELELKLVSQHALETEPYVKGLGNDMGRDNVQKSPADKSTFRCSVIPQEKKTTCSGACTPKQSTGDRRDLSLMQKPLDVPHVPSLKNQSKGPLVTVKEEPEDAERELCDKTKNEACLGGVIQRRCDDDHNSQTLSKLTDTFRSSSGSLDECIVNRATRPTVTSATESIKVSNVSQLSPRIVPKEEITDVPIRPAINSVPACENHLKGKGSLTNAKPFVQPGLQKSTGDICPREAPASTELPIISSVFSMSRGPGAVPGYIRWERSSERVKVTKLDSHSKPSAVSLGVSASKEGVSAGTEQGSAKDILSTMQETSLTVNCRDLQGEVSRNCATNQEKTRTPVTAEVGSPSPSSESLRTLLSCQNDTHSELKNIPTCRIEIVRIPVTNPRTKDKDSTVLSKGAVLKISDSNNQSFPTFKVATEKSEVNGTWIPRPVLFSGLNERNLSETDCSCQNKVPKLSLKRRRSGAENESFAEEGLRVDLQTNRREGQMWKLSKHKKRRKKHRKPLKIKLLSQTASRSCEDMSRLWLVPLKEDQLVKIPGPNQPVVVLNHPKPHALKRDRDAQTMASKDTLPNRASPRAAWSILSCSRRRKRTQQSPSEADLTRHTLKMKLKKTHQNKYQVVGFIYGEFPVKTLKC